MKTIEELEAEVNQLKGALNGAVKIIRGITSAAKMDLNKPLSGLPSTFTVNAVLSEWERMSKREGKQ